jgi:hypothetical protein
LRAGRGLRAAGFFAEVFFFGLAIALLSALLID